MKVYSMGDYKIENFYKDAKIFFIATESELFGFFNFREIVLVDRMPQGIGPS